MWRIANPSSHHMGLSFISRISITCLASLDKTDRRFSRLFSVLHSSPNEHGNNQKSIFISFRIVLLQFGNTTFNSGTQDDAHIETPDVVPSSSSTVDIVPTHNPVEKKGHIIKPISDSPGFFCVKCGLNTKFPKHINLKILKAHCRFAALPPDKWLTNPGQHQVESRLDEEERKLKEEINTPGHDLVWNRKAGRDESKPDSYGWIYCQKCQRTWPWCKRHANIPRSICRKLPSSQPTPQWVLDLNINQPSNSSEPAPHRRICGKTAPTHSHIPIPAVVVPKRFVSLPPHRLQESTHIRELASDSQLFACSGDAACIGAAASPYYFWDPAGPPASFTPDDACVPEVGEHQDEMRQRKHRASHISHIMSFHVLFRAFLALLIDLCGRTLR